MLDKHKSLCSCIGFINLYLLFRRGVCGGKVLLTDQNRPESSKQETSHVGGVTVVAIGFSDLINKLTNVN